MIFIVPFYYVRSMSTTSTPISLFDFEVFVRIHVENLPLRCVPLTSECLQFVKQVSDYQSFVFTILSRVSDSL